MGKSKKKRPSTELTETTIDNEQENDESLIDFLIENDDQLNGQIDVAKEQLEAALNSTNDISGDSEEEEDAENCYNGRVLNRKEYFEQIYLKYAKELYSSDKEKVAKSLRKKIKVVLGEGKDKHLVFVNDEPIEIEQKVQLNHKDTIALQLTKTRLGKW